MSTKKNKVTTTPSVSTIPVKDKGKVMITSEFKAMVDYLCKKISTLEWSGIMFYDIVKGDILSGTEYILKPVFIFPKDKGTPGYTEYDFDDDIVDLYTAHPELEDKHMGHIHSHNSMGVFFSSTDMTEICDNATNFDRYFSLIVNNAGDYCAKVATASKMQVKGKKASTIEYPGLEGNKHTIKYEDENLDRENEVILIKDMDVEVESPELSEFFLDKVKEIDSVRVMGSNAGFMNTGITRYNATDDDKEVDATTMSFIGKILSGDKHKNVFRNATINSLIWNKSEAVVKSDCSEKRLIAYLANTLDINMENVTFVLEHHLDKAIDVLKESFVPITYRDTLDIYIAELEGVKSSINILNHMEY